MKFRDARSAAPVVGGLLALAVLVQFRPWTWPWDRRPGIPLLVLCFVAGLAASLLPPLLRGRRRPRALSYTGVVAAVVVVGAIGVVALVVMLELAAGATVADRAKLQIDAIKYGLGVFAAAGAVAALLLGFRRQQHLEQVHRHTEFDAAERRTTDLYTKAAEQLGSDDAAVRLAGLFALERVAQNNVSQRQTIVNVVCAYLRMPFTPPLPDRPRAEGRDPRQELEVRLTAQRILTVHLRRPDGVEQGEAGAVAQSTDQRFWAGMDLDLTGAALVDWDLYRGDVAHGTFVGATFTGGASFRRTTFGAEVKFQYAAFEGRARFQHVAFGGAATFDNATFAETATFSAATFARPVSFTGATFSGLAFFSDAAASERVYFDDVTFADDAHFDGATFGEDVRFDGTTFGSDVDFGRTAFAGDGHLTRPAP